MVYRPLGLVQRYDMDMQKASAVVEKSKRRTKALLDFLYEIRDGGEVVGIAVLPYIAIETTEWVALALACLGDEEVAVEDFSLPKLQCGTICAKKIGRYDLLVEKVGLVLIVECADTFVVELPSGVEIAPFFRVRGLTCRTEHFGARDVLWIVVQVADDDDFVARIGCLDAVADVFCEGGRSFTERTALATAIA